jgi:hypothetical protein
MSRARLSLRSLPFRIGRSFGFADAADANVTEQGFAAMIISVARVHSNTQERNLTRPG